jgi:hypothetical protein
MPATPDPGAVPAWIQAAVAIGGFVVVSLVVVWAKIKPMLMPDEAPHSMSFRGAAIVQDGHVMVELLTEIRALRAEMRGLAAEKKVRDEMEAAHRMEELLEKLEQVTKPPGSA